jgi:hypothetical protein
MCGCKIFLCLLALLFPLCKSSEPVEISSFTDALAFIQDPNREIINFSRSGNLVKFLIRHYDIEPLSFLSKLLKSNCIPFELFCFSIIAWPVPSYQIRLNLNQRDIFANFILICIEISKIVSALFYKPHSSEEEMAKRFSIIKLYIKFAKRYIEYPGAESCPEYIKEHLRELESYVKNWKFAIRILPKILPNGTAICNEQFFAIFHWIMSRSTFPKYEEFDLDYSNQQFLFSIIIRHMILKKDIDLFKFVHPELPFLVGFMLNYTNYHGEDILSSEYRYSYYHGCLERFFEPNRKLQSLIKTLKGEEYMVKLAKKELGLDTSQSYSTFLLIDSLERIPLLCQSKNHHNIVWQLKGYTLIREFLETSKFNKSIRK